MLKKLLDLWRNRTPLNGSEMVLPTDPKISRALDDLDRKTSAGLKALASSTDEMCSEFCSPAVKAGS